MSKLNLNVKLKHIRELEKDGKPFTDKFDKGVTGLCDFMNACGKTDDEIEGLLKEFGYEEVSTMVLEELQEAGFLPKAMNIRQTMKDATKTL